MSVRIERIAFFGTPEFAVPSLERLVAADRSPSVVVTQPSRPAGRRGASAPPPVARTAEALGLECWQERRVRRAEFVERLAALEPDLAVVVAFGQIFPQALLEIPRHGCVNVHASLLPEYRGAAPVAAAIADGRSTTGVTTMLMEAGLDSGPILLQRETAIERRDTRGTLSSRLADLGAALLVETVAELETGRLRPRPQDDAQATFAPRLEKSDGRVDWGRGALDIERLLRAHDPWPGTTAALDGEPVRLLAARVAQPAEADRAAVGRGALPGEILGLADDALLVCCGDGTVLAVERLQRAGRRPVDGRSFWNGARLAAGARFDAAAPEAVASAAT